MISMLVFSGLSAAKTNLRFLRSWRHHWRQNDARFHSKRRLRRSEIFEVFFKQIYARSFKSWCNFESRAHCRFFDEEKRFHSEPERCLLEDVRMLSRHFDGKTRGKCFKEFHFTGKFYENDSAHGKVGRGCLVFRSLYRWRDPETLILVPVASPKKSILNPGLASIIASSNTGLTELSHYFCSTINITKFSEASTWLWRKIHSQFRLTLESGVTWCWEKVF